MRIFALVIAALALAGACGEPRPPADGGPRKPSVRFKHGDLPAGWRRSKIDGTALAFDHAALHATITAFANCKGIEDVSLSALVQQELVGVEKRDVVTKSEAAVDGREAADWVVKGELDGVPVEMELLVTRQSGCVYDLVLVSSPATFESARADFAGFVKGFDVLP